jgi:hypothetical protein
VSQFIIAIDIHTFPFLHCQITIGTIQQLSCTSPRPPSLLSLTPCIMMRSPTNYAGPTLHKSMRLSRTLKRRRCLPWTTDRGSNNSRSSTGRVRPDSTTRNGTATTYGIDGGNRRLVIEGGVGEYRLSSRRNEARLGMAEWMKDIRRTRRSKVRALSRPVGEKSSDAVNSIIDWGSRAGNSSQSCLTRWCLVGDCFRSTVIVASPHCKCYWGFKKLTAVVCARRCGH